MAPDDKKVLEDTKLIMNSMKKRFQGLKKKTSRSNVGAFLFKGGQDHNNNAPNLGLGLNSSPQIS